MKKRILTWILAVVMILTTVTVVPFTASAAETFADDATAIAAGYVFKVGDLYYNSIFEAVVDVPEDGTVYLLADYTFSTNSNNNTTMIGYGTGLDGSNPKTYTIDGLIGGSSNAEFTINTGSYALDFYASNVTLKNLDILSSNTTARTVIRVTGGSTVTLKDCNVTIGKNLWGGIAIYNGNMVFDGSTVTVNSINSNKYLIHLQSRNGDAYWCGAPTATNIQSTANITFKGNNTFVSDVEGFSMLNGNGANVTVYPGSTANANYSVVRAPSAVAAYETGSYANLSAEERTSFAAFAALFSLNVVPYASDAAAIAAGKYFRIGEVEGATADYFANLPAAANAVENNGTIHLIDDITINSQQIVNPASYKTFTFAADGHIITATTVQYVLDFQNCNVTIEDLAFIDSLDLNQMPLRVFEGASMTLVGCNITVQRPSWGAIGAYGNLTLDSTRVTIGKNGGNTAPAIRVQLDNSRAFNPVITLDWGAQVIGNDGQPAIGIYNNTSGTYTSSLVIKSNAVTITGAIDGAFNSYDLQGPSELELTDAEETAAWKALYLKFAQEWPYETVAMIGATEYTSISSALAAVQNDQTITLVTDLIATVAVDNGKTFTIDGGDYSITGNPALRVNAGSAVTLTNVTIDGTDTRTAVEMNGGTLTLGDGAIVINPSYDGSNSKGNAIRGTAAGSTVNVLNGATINAAMAFVFDNQTGTVNISGGAITVSFYGFILTGAAVTANITGGTITNTNAYGTNGIFRSYNANPHHISITGGVINFAGSSLVTNNAGGAMATPACVTIGGTAVINNTTTGDTLDAAAAAAAASTALASLDVVAGGVALRLPEEASAENSGIAFGYQIDRDAYAALVSAGLTVTTGTVILPTDLLAGATSLEEVIAAGTTKLDVANSGWYNAAEPDDFYLWYGSIVELQAANYGREFTSFGYLAFSYTVPTIGSVPAVAGMITSDGQVGTASALAAAAARGTTAQNAILDLYAGA